jgi:predicted dehydrogenase
MTSKTSNATGNVSRRHFIATTAVSGAGLVLASSALVQSAESGAGKTRYALVGVGSRAGMYRKAVLQTYAANSEMVGYCDLNLGRLKLAQRQARESAKVEVPIYEAKDFDRLIHETKPEVVIVTTKDATHNQYIIRAMELGCDIMTEKPMTTDEEKCRAILDKQRETGRRLTVNFNYRYSPPRTQVKDVLMSGVIGDVLSVDFH